MFVIRLERHLWRGWRNLYWISDILLQKSVCFECENGNFYVRKMFILLKTFLSSKKLLFCFACFVYNYQKTRKLIKFFITSLKTYLFFSQNIQCPPAVANQSTKNFNFPMKIFHRRKKFYSKIFFMSGFGSEALKIFGMFWCKKLHFILLCSS